jgi:1-acyl-sn-glycerol-3-phosphate acyltransferase
VIRARKNPLFGAWFSRHAEGRIKATFGRVWVHGLDAAREASRQGPLLLVSNHCSWWDPLVAIHVTERLLAGEGYAMMDAKNLERLPFFSLIGAFGVDLSKPSDGASAIRYAAGLLDKPGRLLWVFPQGRERPSSVRPLDFRPGSGEIARVAKVPGTIPVGIRYEFGGEERPELWLSFGPSVPWSKDAKATTAAHERAVTSELDRIEGALREPTDHAFVALHRQAPSVFARWAEAWLAWATRPRRRLQGAVSNGSSQV